MEKEGIKLTTKRLYLLAVFMFGFGFALVPIYNVFCEVTGLNGKTGEIIASEAEALVADKERLVTVEFDTNLNEELPWSFIAKEYKMKVHPGQVSDAIFIVKNKTDRPIIGQAIPSVAPAQASLFFNKTECFCFTRQTLQAHEEREMLVRFVVDAKLPEKIETMTLSYTFFLATDENEITKL
ncbi:MAG: cytochrome c oxidase assembly protein [Gammaproteobacteria bacterium]